MNATNLNPTKKQNSICFECNAGMCSECSSKHEWDMVNMIEFLDSEKHNCCDLLILKPEYGYFSVD